MGVGRPCPPVRNYIVTPRQFFFMPFTHQKLLFNSKAIRRFSITRLRWPSKTAMNFRPLLILVSSACLAYVTAGSQISFRLFMLDHSCIPIPQYILHKSSNCVIEVMLWPICAPRWLRRNEWKSEWMNDSFCDEWTFWKNEWMNVWMNKCMNEWMNIWMNEWRNESMNEWTTEWKWMWEGMRGIRNEERQRLRDRQTNQRTDQRIEMTFYRCARTHTGMYAIIIYQ